MTETRPRLIRSTLIRMFAIAALVIGGFATAQIAAAPTAQSATCYTFPRTLSQGASGSDVVQLQIRIAGWVPRGQVMGIDGSFGPQTKTALVNFQRGYGLVADGIAGPATYSKISALSKSDCSPLHFTYAEASYNCGKGFTGTAANKENMKRALWRAEALRHQLGDHPLKVTSGYRDYACNKSVGGASNSIHLTGGALDLVPGDSGTTLCSIAKRARNAGFGGIFGPGYPGHYDHVHVDIRTSIAWDADACSGW